MAIFLKEKLEEKLDEKTRVADIDSQIASYGNAAEINDFIEICKGSESQQIMGVKDFDNAKKNSFYEFNKLYKKKIMIEKLSGSNFAECALLLSCYDSISDKNSGLRQAIKFGLFCLLNCERDFQKLGKSVFVDDESLSGFFNESLRLEVELLYDNGLILEYKMLKDSMSKWNDFSSSLYSRLIGKKEDREKRHKEIKGEGNEGVEGAYRYFKQEMLEAKGARRGHIDAAKFVSAPKRR